MADTNQFAVVEAAYIEHEDLADYRRAGFSHVDPGAEFVFVYLTPDYERYQLDENGQLLPLYTGRRLDARTFIPRGQPLRSNDPEELRQWWKRVTGNPSSSPALMKTGDEREDAR